MRKAVKDSFRNGGFPEVQNIESNMQIAILQGYINIVLMKDVSEKSRMINPVKIYAIDTGLINAMTFQNSSNFGPILENMVFMHLRRKNYRIEYVNTVKGLETDFFARNLVTHKVKLIQIF